MYLTSLLWLSIMGAPCVQRRVGMGTIAILLLLVGTGWGLGIKDVVIIVLSQPNEHHLKLAEKLKEDVEEQSGSSYGDKPIVRLSHKDFNHVGHWTVLPLLPQLYALFGKNSSWFVFVEDRTKINLKNLRRVLDKYDTTKPIWLGHALHDDEATIIHHFAFYDDPKQFQFPNLASGIAINAILLERLNDKFKRRTGAQSEFGIDASHELALFIWDKGKGEVLTDEIGFCLDEEERCAAFPKRFEPCGEAVGLDSIYFAVKTCKKFHGDRVPVVKKTWARYASNVEFFSDVEDNSIPTTTLGIPNTEQGHCAKTIAILHHIALKLRARPKIRWIVIADDDTILGVSRIQQLLTCHNSSAPVALGERYGYNVLDRRGYAYITGGGGMVFSRTMLEKLTGKGTCECPSANAPDDMFLGVCIASMGMSVTHSPLFHQARPIDYPSEYLSTKDAVSFHKHWMIDPVGVYESWFGGEDRKLKEGREEL